MNLNDNLSEIIKSELINIFMLNGIKDYYPSVKFYDDYYIIIVEYYVFSLNEYSKSREIIERFCNYFDYFLEDGFPDKHSYYIKLYCNFEIDHIYKAIKKISNSTKSSQVIKKFNL